MILAALLLAQAATPACTATDAKLPPSLAGWTRRATTLEGGRAVTLPSLDRTTIRMPGLPPVTRDGRVAMTRFRVRTSGTYGIALDQRGWIDVYGAGAAALESTAHGHGPDCSTIAKVVRFTLAPGEYRVVLSGLQKPDARLMLVTG